MAGKGKRFVVVAAVVVAVLLLVLLIAPGMLICPAVGTGGSLALGVPVTLKGAGLNPLSAMIGLKGLDVGNPPGYTTKHAIEVGRIEVHAPLPRLIRRVPRIESVVIEEPAVTLEQGLTGSNLSDLLTNTTKVQTAGRQVRVVIGSLRIVGAKVSVVPKIAGAIPAVVPLPPLELKELGGEGGAGVTLSQTIAAALQQIVTATVANGGGLIPPELGASLNSSVDAVNKAGLQAVGAVSETGKQAAAAVSEKSQQAASAVSDTGKQAIGAAGGAVKGLMDSAKGLVGGAGQEK